MTDQYVSPLDDRVRPSQPLATRPPDVRRKRVALLDIRKNRGVEFLDAIEVLLVRSGADTERFSKETFSKPAGDEVIEAIAKRADLVVEALAD